MPRFSDRLQEVVAYESRPRESLFQEQVWHIYLLEEKLLHAFSLL